MHEWHKGELAVHRKLKLTTINGTHFQSVLPSMPAQHQLFFSELPYFIASTIDGHGRPWASILCGQVGFVSPVSPNHLALCTTIAAVDPIYKNLEGGGPVAGLGIQFSNRRRNKVFGRVLPSMVRLSSGRELQLILTTSESLGNCPKYISTRNLTFYDRSGVSQDIIKGMARLDKTGKALIARSDTLFFATKGEDDLDVNHRGGPPGFARVDSVEGADVLVIPDYSGNRFFSSLGNIEATGVAGITFCDFTTGDLLYITGSAYNVLDAEQAEALMPGAQRLTCITVQEWRYQAASLNLKVAQSDATQVGVSPYTPRLFTLATEAAHDAKPLHKNRKALNEATLIHKKPLTPTISRFTFSFSKPEEAWKAGQHVILDFSREADRGYAHMDDDNPKSLNDDFIRSWTITSSPNGPQTSTCSQFEVTVRRSGVVSSLIHALDPDQHAHHRLVVPMLGITGDFQLDQQPDRAETKVLFVMGGIGITPFVAFMAQARAESRTLDVAILFTSSEADKSLLELLYTETDSTVTITYERQFGGSGSGSEENGKRQQRRIRKDDLEAVPDWCDRTIYFCGPPGLLKQLRSWTTKDIRFEEFSY